MPEVFRQGVYLDKMSSLNSSPTRSCNTIKLKKKKHRSIRSSSEAKPLLHIPPSRTPYQIPSSKPPAMRISLPITKAIIKSKEDIRKLAIIRVVSRITSIKSLSIALLAVLNPAYYGNITPYDDPFLFLMASEKVVIAMVKKDPITFDSLLGHCTIRLAPMSP